MKRPPEPTSQDLARWRTLVKVARAAAERPGAPVGDLDKAVRQARKAIVLGVLGRENACVQLVRLGDRFAGETRRARAELAPELRRLADEVDARLQAALDPQPPPDVQRRFRADLDG